MAEMTFTIDGGPGIEVHVEEVDGDLRFTVTVLGEGGLTGDLRGIFFQLADPALLAGLTLTSADGSVTEFQAMQDGVINLGQGANMQGAASPYDIGVEIGTAGIGRDDWQQTTFVLSHASSELSLDLIAQQEFGVRLTSVGLEDGTRTDGLKLVGVAGEAIDARDDALAANEDAGGTWNVLGNDDAGGGPALAVGGFTVDGLRDGAEVTLGADGVLTLLTNGAYENLGAHDSETVRVTYSVGNGAGGFDTAVATITVQGVNDAPDARDDAEQTDAATAVTIDVLANDGDVDGATPPSLLSLSGATSEKGAAISIVDGMVVYDPSGVAALQSAVGDSVADSFTYTIVDDAGETATATVNLSVAGTGTGGGGGYEIATLGFYDTGFGLGGYELFPAITPEGMTAVNLSTLTAGDLASVDALFVTVSNNFGSYGGEYLAALPQIADFVQGGGILFVHDRLIAGIDAILPGIGDATAVRDVVNGDDIEIVDDAGPIASGPGGMLNDASLDFGDLSHQGYALVGTLPAGAEVLLTTEDPTRAVTFAYQYGAGAVVYSTIPLDYHLTDQPDADVTAAMAAYATNLLAAFDSGNDIFA